MNKKVLRAFATVLSGVFFLMSGPLAHAFEINQFIQSKPTIASLPSISKKTLYFIHDIHAQKEAQISIGTLLGDLQKKNTIGFVGLEGVEGGIDVEPLRKQIERPFLKAVANFLLRENQISGPVHASLLSETPFVPMVGIESVRDYDQHVSVYKQAAPTAGWIKREIARLQKLQVEQKVSTLPQDLRNFHSHVRAYRKGLVSLSSHLDFLASLKLPLSQQVKLYRQALALEQEMSTPKVQSEKTRFLATLTRRLSGMEQSHLLTQTQALGQGRITNTDFFEELRRLADAKAIDMTPYNHLRRYFDYTHLVAQIKIEKMPEEILLLEQVGYRTLVASPKERSIVEASHYLDLADKLVRFSLTPTEWMDYQEFKKSYATPTLAGLVLFERFYEWAQRRDETLAQNIFRVFRTSRSHSGAVVVGGFHFQGIRERLEKKGISVVSLVPSVSADSLSNSSSSYLKQLYKDNTQLERLLLGSIWTLGLKPDGLGAGGLFGTALRAAVSPSGQSGLTQTPLGNGVSRVDFRNLGNGQGTAVAQTPQGAVEALVAGVSGSIAQDNLIIGTGNIKTHARAGFFDLGSVAVAADAAFRVFMAVPAQLYRQLQPLVFSMRLVLLAVLAPIVVSLGSCGLLGPPDPQEAKLPWDLQSTFSRTVGVEEATRVGWLDVIKDERLKKDILEALEKNPDIQFKDFRSINAAAARGAWARRWPSLSYSGGASRSNVFSSDTDPTDLLNGSLNFNWGQILWGPVHGLAENAEIQTKIADLQYKDSRELLAVTMAQLYRRWGAVNEQIKLLNQQIVDFNTLLQMVRDRVQLAGGAPADVLNVEAEIGLVQSQIKGLEREAAILKHAYLSLMGRDPSGDIEEPVFSNEEIPQVPNVTPSMVLDERFVTQAAILGIRAQYARVKSAHWARFPSLGLDAQIAYLKNQTSFPEIGQLPAVTSWNVIASLTGPLFRFGELLAQVDFEVENEKIAVSLWIKTVIQVLKEMEDRLSDTQLLSEQENALLASVKAKREHLRLAWVSHRTGQLRTLDLIGITAELRRGELSLLDLQAGRWSNYFSHMYTAGRTAETPAPTDKEVQADPSQKKPAGGSWFKNEFYKSHVSWWVETPLLFVAIFTANLFNTYLSVLPWEPVVNAALIWAALPTVFFAGHITNPEAFWERPVYELTAWKVAIAVVGFGLSVGSVPMAVSLLVVGPMVGWLTLVHRRINKNIVVQAIAANNSEVAKTFRYNIKTSGKSVAEYQSTFQAQMVVRGKKVPQVDLAPTHLGQKGLRVEIVPPTLSESEIGRFVEARMSTRGKKEGLLFLSHSHGFDQLVKEALRNRKGAVSTFDPTIFSLGENGEVDGILLAALDQYLQSKKYYETASTIQLVTTESMPFLKSETDQISPQLRAAIFVILNAQLASVPFTYGAIEQMATKALIAARQA